MSETLLAALPSLGLPVLALVISLGALGVPMMPASLMLLVSGTLVAAGDLPLLPTAATALTAALLSDNLGYALGRGARGRVLDRRGAVLDQAHRLLRRRGDVAVFLSRWLFAPLGPPMNLLAGAAEMRWRRFLLWDLAGEIVWVSGYMALGASFAPFVPQIADMAGNLTALLACLAVAWLALMLLRRAPKRRSR
ncbi:VTT domain-containing protein [Salipiger sp. P9]|uniref:DedA family protein n=1 Tax=Salipiger pentaromativorans TaxID=2943193 RepID=UPI0021574646|nr:VTT domain-containing protein [Salipiger pentaromativorans]MCR8547154.1 VTT domain-containing protein [Salipiger pentaromativorans]